MKKIYPGILLSITYKIIKEEKYIKYHSILKIKPNLPLTYGITKCK